jgi:hypothetical protein
MRSRRLVTASLQCHDLDRQGQPSRAIAFARSARRTGALSAGSHGRRCIGRVPVRTSSREPRFRRIAILAVSRGLDGRAWLTPMVVTGALLAQARSVGSGTGKRERSAGDRHRDRALDTAVDAGANHGCVRPRHEHRPRNRADTRTDRRTRSHGRRQTARGRTAN